MAWYWALLSSNLTDREITTVWSVFTMDIITSALGTVFAYNSLASGWGDLDVLYRIPWVIPPMPIVCGFSALFNFVLSSMLHSFSRISSPDILLLAYMVLESQAVCSSFSCIG